MAVRIFLTSGGQRIVENADGVRTSGMFFIITWQHPRTGETETVLTLRSQDVAGAEIVKNGVVVDYVLGGDQASK